MIDTKKDMNVKVTDLGTVLRVDMNNLGAYFTDDITADNYAPWAHEQNEAICSAITEVLKPYGGSFSDCVQWSVNSGRFYDSADMRNIRRPLFGENYRAAITTVGWLKRRNKSVSIQVVAYVPKTGVSIEKRAVQPLSLYDTEWLGLAPGVITGFNGITQLMLSGVVAWDKDLKPMHSDNPRVQIRKVLDMMISAFQEYGGDKSGILELRPYMHSPETTELLLEEVRDIWGEENAPILINADNYSFGETPKLFTEIQVIGVLNGKVTSRLSGGIMTKTVSSPEMEYILIGNFQAADEGIGKTIGKVSAAIAENRLAPEEICLAYGYCEGEDFSEEFTAALQGILPAQAIHVVPCKEMPTLKGGRLQLGITAMRPVADKSFRTDGKGSGKE